MHSGINVKFISAFFSSGFHLLKQKKRGLGKNLSVFFPRICFYFGLVWQIVMNDALLLRQTRKIHHAFFICVRFFYLLLFFYPQFMSSFHLSSFKMYNVFFLTFTYPSIHTHTHDTDKKNFLFRNSYIKAVVPFIFDQLDFSLVFY